MVFEAEEGVAVKRARHVRVLLDPAVVEEERRGNAELPKRIDERLIYPHPRRAAARVKGQDDRVRVGRGGDSVGDAVHVQIERSGGKGRVGLSRRRGSGARCRAGRGDCGGARAAGLRVPLQIGAPAEHGGTGGDESAGEELCATELLIHSAYRHGPAGGAQQWPPNCPHLGDAAATGKRVDYQVCVVQRSCLSR